MSSSAGALIPFDPDDHGLDLTNIPAQAELNQAYDVLRNDDGIAGDKHISARINALQMAIASHLPELIQHAERQGIILPDSMDADQEELKFLIHHAHRQPDIDVRGVFEALGVEEVAFHAMLAALQEQGLEIPEWLLGRAEAIRMDQTDLPVRMRVLQDLKPELPLDQANLGLWMNHVLHYPMINLQNYESFTTPEEGGWSSIDVEGIYAVILAAYPALTALQFLEQRLDIPLSEFYEAMSGVAKQARVTIARLSSRDRFGAEIDDQILDAHRQLKEQIARALILSGDLHVKATELEIDEVSDVVQETLILCIQDMYQMYCYAMGQEPRNIAGEAGLEFTDELRYPFQRTQVLAYMNEVKRIFYRALDAAVFTYEDQQLVSGNIIIPLQRVILEQVGLGETRDYAAALTVMTQLTEDHEVLSLNQVAAALAVPEVLLERVGSYDWETIHSVDWLPKASEDGCMAI